ncbi:hypothetical protein Q7P37_004779 [Cladosporium fusiforme]
MAHTATPNARISLEEREVHRIYQPWLSAHGSSLNVADHVESLAYNDLQDQGYQARASRDKALTAFAQLVALRLDVRRCMISLIDTSSQYILAEATRTVSIASSKTAEDDELWLGSAVLSRPDAICEHSMFNVCTAVDEESGQTFTAKGLIVPDCRLDERFKDRPYVLSEPGVRFYAGVPVYSRNGYVIGSVAVSDEIPRNSLKVEELKLMQETSQSYVLHFPIHSRNTPGIQGEDSYGLHDAVSVKRPCPSSRFICAFIGIILDDLNLTATQFHFVDSGTDSTFLGARDRVDRFKGERIVRGMASFIEGCTSLRDDLSGSESGQEKPVNPSTEPIHAAESHLPSQRQRPPLVSRNSGRRQKMRISNSSSFSSASKGEKGDSMSRMFHRAAEILRQSTLADGAAIFGATATSGRGSYMESMAQFPPNSSQLGNGVQEGANDPHNADPTPSSDSEKWETNTSDSDSTPTARPCKILGFSIADDQARADVERGSALTLGTLEKYFSLFPKGKTFSFTDQGSGVSSEDDSGASDREVRRDSPTSTKSDVPDNFGRARARKRRMDHKELLKKIPGAKTVVFIPLYDHSEERLMAGCFLWTSVTGRMMSLDADLSYLRAFGNCIVSEVTRVNMQRNEAAKTTFIASMSHELRSPLHGILGAAEFLADTASDAYQSGLITSIVTCGRTLLDTLNHVLDYSKINKLGRAQMRRHAKQNKLVNLSSDSSLESLSMTGEIDLGTLVEEVAEAVSAGHAFKKLPITGSVTNGQPDSKANAHSKDDSSSEGSTSGGVSLLLDVSPKRSWMIRTQPGAIRRIIMNLLGNSLKYTSNGFVAVSLRAQEVPNSSKINAILRVTDSGKGMSENYQHDRMFVPFSQEDPFQPGTGLGLSIVKSIVDSLGGTLEVKSQQGVGTEIDVHLSLTPATEHATTAPEDDLCALGEKTRGRHLVLLDSEPPRNTTHHITRLEETIRETCESWFGMRVTKAQYMGQDDADIYLYSEPPPLDKLVERHRKIGRGARRNHRVPIIIVYVSAEEAVSITRDQQEALNDLGSIVEVISQPCGPRKLAKVLNICLRRAEEARVNEPYPDDTPPETPTETSETLNSSTELPLPAPDPPSSSETQDLVKSMSAAVSYPSPPPFNPSTPPLHLIAPTSQAAPTSGLHVLLVDDNKINRNLLVMFMKKHKFSYEEAENGQEALDAYKASCLPGPHSDAPSRRFDFVLMDISMPVMDGMESTRKIREFEKENGLKKANVIALTGLASAQAQQEAEAAGIDVFLPKPVKFAELKKLLANGKKADEVTPRST